MAILGFGVKGMTAYPQHEAEVSRVKAILSNIPGAIVLENDSGPHGHGGYRFPRTFNGVNPEGVEYIADVYAILPDNRRVIIEIDGMKSGQGHSGTIASHKGNLRDSFFAQFGIPAIHYATGDISRMKLGEADIMRDIEYGFRQLRKAVMLTAPPIRL